MSACTVNAPAWFPELFITPVRHLSMLAGEFNHSDLFRSVLAVCSYAYSHFHAVSNATRVRTRAQRVHVASDAVRLLYATSRASNT